MGGDCSIKYIAGMAVDEGKMPIFEPCVVNRWKIVRPV